MTIHSIADVTWCSFCELSLYTKYHGCTTLHSGRFLVRVLVAEALASVAEALPSGCGGSARFFQKQSQLLVLGLRLEFDNKIFVRKVHKPNLRLSITFFCVKEFVYQAL